MRNRIRIAGVYPDMCRVSLFLVCLLTAAAQPSPQADPMEAAIRAIWKARDSGGFGELAARREEARALLQGIPAGSPRFDGWVQQVALAYETSGFSVRARAVWEDALRRVAPAGGPDPSSIAMLNGLANSWRSEGNLLTAASCLEQAAAAQAAAPPPAPASSGPDATIVMGKYFVVRNGRRQVYAENIIGTYIQLAGIYRELGRRDAVDAIASKIRALSGTGQLVLARFYEQQQQLDQAASIYQKIAAASPDPEEAVDAWQSLANLEARQSRYTDAIDAMQNGIAAAQSSGRAGLRRQTLWMRRTLAGYMQGAGQAAPAEQVYRQLLEENRGQPEEGDVLGMYAEYLADTNRGAQGEGLLKQYLAGSSNLEPQKQINAYFQLANLARRAGNTKEADEYQQKGQALQPQPLQGFGAGSLVLIGDDLEQAEIAANEHRLDDAYRLALQVVDRAAQAIDGQQAGWRIPQIAQSLVAGRQSARAGQLFEHLIAQAQNSSADDRQMLVAATRGYAGFLMSQKDRAADVPAAIERFRGVLVEGAGPESGSLAEPLRMKLEFARAQSQWDAVDAAARELLQLQQSLSGNTSEPYWNDLQAAAAAYEAGGDYARALPLRRKTVAIADLFAGPVPGNDWRPSEARLYAALDLAHLGQFEEAEALGEEAVAKQGVSPVPGSPILQQLEQIRRMKLAAAADRPGIANPK